MSGFLAAVPGIVLAIVALPVLAAAAYLGALTLASLWPRHAPSGRTDLRFDVVVPAHDEEAGIARTVESLMALEYPRDRYRILVVADNCTDATAARARSAGASVLERWDPERRGKGYALALAFDASAAAGLADAVVVVDADTVVTPNLLSALAARLERGEEAAQADYGVRNGDDSWRTRLMTIAFTLFHGVRSLGRERLRLSCGLRGNGMAFTHRLLARIPHDAFSVVEDVEYGLRLGAAGVRVAYVAEARVLGEMPGTAQASTSQRARWEGGRRTLSLAWTPRLLRAGLIDRDAVSLDLAADLLVPPLAQLGTAVAIGSVLSVAALVAGATHAWPAAGLWLAALLALAVYVGRGCVLSGIGPRVVLDLLWAPVYVVWKLGRRMTSGRGAPRMWERTQRGPGNNPGI